MTSGSVTSPTDHGPDERPSGHRPDALPSSGAADDRARFRRELGQQLRVDSVRSSAAAGSGHPTSSMSAADLIAVLIDGHLRLDVTAPENPGNDHLIFSKGHASPLYYSMLKALGGLEDDELLTFRRLGSRLEGHPTPRIPPTEVATGSLGLGVPIGVGLALAGRDLDHVPYRVWVLCGDSELAEGSIWEGLQHAAWARLDRLTVIVDVNRLGQTRETMLGWDLPGYAARAEAFGWHVLTIDGHDVEEIEAAYLDAEQARDRPTIIFARTLKGRGVQAVENLPGFHGRPLDDPEAAIAELGGRRELRVRAAAPLRAGVESEAARARAGASSTSVRLPRYELGTKVATREAYGETLVVLGEARGDVVALDGEVSNSTRADLFAQRLPERYFEMFIAEQQLVAAAVGLQVRGWTAYASTFAAFLTRAHDVVRMAAISRADVRLVGSHAGVSIGEDGPSQMALEDIAMLRAVYGSTVLHPSDARQTAALTVLLADVPGVSYLRTLRSPTVVRTGDDEVVRIGGSRVAAGGGPDDDVTVIACGVCVDEAVAAAETLLTEGVRVRVLDCYSIKPLDVEAVRAAARETGRLVTVEDHHPEGGLGEAVAAALADSGDAVPVRRLAVRIMPTSGTGAELRHVARIDAAAIREAVRP